VAESRRANPQSVLLVTRDDSVTVKFWFGSRTMKTRTAATTPAGVWIVLFDREEGLVAYSDHHSSGGHFHGYEEGRLVLLTPEGRLVSSRYRISLYQPISSGPAWEQHELTDMRPATASDIVSFDRLNRADYREDWHRSRATLGRHGDLRRLATRTRS
jgi:hypothetical protein